MTILNLDQQRVPYLDASQSPPYKDLRQDLFLNDRYEHDNGAGKFFCFEFKNGDEFDIFPLHSLITNGDIEMIKCGEAKLVLCNSHEAFHRVVAPLYKSLVVDLGISPKHIILLSESADILLPIKEVSNRLGVEQINAVWMRRMETDVLKDTYGMKSLPMPVHIRLQNKVYTKKYCCFNRRWRMHRPAIVALLYAYGLLDYGYVSLGASDYRETWENVFPWIQYWIREQSEATELLAANKDNIVNLPPLYLDTEDLVTNRAELTDSTNEYYNNTYFSVVPETIFFSQNNIDNGRLISEKTFKPIAQHHPFIVLSVPFFLEKVREIGYKTFSPWINESYDTELDDPTRMMMVLKEIDRLCKLSPTELTIFLDNVREICNYNHKVFVGKTNYFTELN